MSFALSLCQSGDAILSEPVHSPFVHWAGAEGFIEPYAWSVPIEAAPLHPSAATFFGDRCQMAQYRLPITVASVLWEDEHILQIEPRFADESGEIVKEEGETHLFPVHSGKDYLRRPLLEQPFF